MSASKPIERPRHDMYRAQVETKHPSGHPVCRVSTGVSTKGRLDPARFDSLLWFLVVLCGSGMCVVIPESHS